MEEEDEVTEALVRQVAKEELRFEALERERRRLEALAGTWRAEADEWRREYQRFSAEVKELGDIIGSYEAVVGTLAEARSMRAELELIRGRKNGAGSAALEGAPVAMARFSAFAERGKEAREGAGGESSPSSDGGVPGERRPWQPSDGVDLPRTPREESSGWPPGEEAWRAAILKGAEGGLFLAENMKLAQRAATNRRHAWNRAVAAAKAANSRSANGGG